MSHRCTAAAPAWLAATVIACAALTAPAPAGCPADLDGDGFVEIDDLLTVVLDWACTGDPGRCAGDANLDGLVGVGDLVLVVLSWGACPEQPVCDLDVDTDRDGTIEDADDEADEDDWTTGRGALYMVNCNDDDGDSKSDGLEFDTAEMPVNEDLTINGFSDTADITRFVVRAVGNLAGKEVVLQAPLAQIRTVHVFKAVAAGQASIWGGPVETDDEVDITSDVSATADTTMGLEGLYFRFDKAGHPMHFPGYLDLTLLVRDATFPHIEYCSDQVRLKVAPWIMLPNSQASMNLYARDMGADNLAFRTTLALSGQLETYATDDQWAQDPVEIGYTQTPTAMTWASAHIQHHGGTAPGGDVAWLRAKLLSPLRGLYRRPSELTVDVNNVGSDGEYGGNLEVMPPVPGHPLGRIVHGNSMSMEQRLFLQSQEVQPPIDPIDTTWLAVGHVDELMGFYKGGAPIEVVIASPNRAFALLGAPLPGGSPGPGEEPPPDHEVLFGLGETAPGVALGATPGSLLAVVPPGDWGYVRIYEGPGAGQIAEVAGLAPGVITIGTVWGPYEPVPSVPIVGPAAASPHGTFGYEPIVADDGWIEMPGPGSLFVLIEDALFWHMPGAPPAGLPGAAAPITVKEVKNNLKLRNLNVKAQVKINDARNKLTAGAGGAGNITFLEVPVIYTATADLDAAGEIVLDTAHAWNPGLANFQLAGGKAFFPAQPGPKTGGGVNVFQNAVTTVLGAAPEFADDWKGYHVGIGEVHCGSNVRRQIFGFSWWDPP
jgi:hypothetical protein